MTIKSPQHTVVTLGSLSTVPMRIDNVNYLTLGCGNGNYCAKKNKLGTMLTSSTQHHTIVIIIIIISVISINGN